MYFHKVRLQHQIRPHFQLNDKVKKHLQDVFHVLIKENVIAKYNHSPTRTISLAAVIFSTNTNTANNIHLALTKFI